MLDHLSLAKSLANVSIFKKEKIRECSCGTRLLKFEKCFIEIKKAFFLFSSMSTTYSLGPEFSLLTLSMYKQKYTTRKTTKRHVSRSSSLFTLMLYVHINTFGKSPRDVTYSQLFKKKNLSFAAQVLGTHGSFVDRFFGYNVRNGMNPSIPMILRSSESESSLSSFLSL